MIYTKKTLGINKVNYEKTPTLCVFLLRNPRSFTNAQSVEFTHFNFYLPFFGSIPRLTNSSGEERTTKKLSKRF